MSLGRLLAAGKSLVGLSGADGRYRLDKRARLPKFVSPKNPFVSGDTPSISPSPAGTPAVTKEVAAPSPTVAKGTEKKFSRATMTARAGMWFGNWGQKLKPLSGRLRLRGPARSAAPTGTGAGLQTELSLDAIKVVRNDLSDTDFVVVSRAEAKPASPLVALTAEKVAARGGGVEPVDPPIF